MDQARPTSRLIRLVRCFRLILHFLWIGFGAAAIYPLISEQRRLQLKQRWSERILSILAVRLEVHSIDAPPGSLIVANHISWLDIFAINSVRPAAFISKSEVRNWPFIGWLAARNDTVFLRRGSRGHARLVNTEIDNLLSQGKDVALFPEGLTTDGTELLGFHAALLQPAIETRQPVLPIALAYLDEQGNRSLAPSFAGEITLPQCFSSILASRSLSVSITLLPAIQTNDKTRRDLSQAAHRAIEAALATRPGFRPSNIQPEKSPDPQA